MKIASTLVCALFALAAPALGQEAARPASPASSANQARVEVHKGRCVVLAEGRAERSLRQGEDARLDGANHLEVGAGSEVRVSWPGRASVHLWGPAALQWEERPGQVDEAKDTFGDRGLEWHLFDVAWADIEVRRGEHRLHLPGDWRCELEGGATYVRGLAGGPVEVRHQAGSPVRLEWVGDPDRARPPLSIYAGSSVRLERPPVARGDEQARGDGPARSGQAWERPGWPYRAPVDRPGDARRRQELEHTTRRQDRFPTEEEALPVVRAKVPEFTERTGVKVEIEPVTGPVTGPAADGGPRAARSAPDARPRGPQGPAPAPRAADEPTARPTTVEPTPLAPFTGQPAVQQPEVSEPVLPEALETPQPPPTFEAAQWGGHALRQLEPCGSLAVERAEGVELRLFASGRRKVFVDSEAPRGVWCYGPDEDHLLAPGTVAVFEADGRLRMAFGDIDSRPAPEGRPSFDRVSH